jgi:hypothetical protein
MLIYTSNQRNKHTFNRFLSEFHSKQLSHAYSVWWLSAVSISCELHYFSTSTHPSLPKVRKRMCTAAFPVYTTLLHLGQQILYSPSNSFLLFQLNGCCYVNGVRHPQHTQTGSNTSTIAQYSSNGLTNTRCCRYSCMRSWWWVEVPPETCRAVSIYK